SQGNLCDFISLFRGKKLKLEGKELVSVPFQLFSLEALQVLEMSPERESCLKYKMDLIPHEIGHLRNLTLLYLDSNNLKELPIELGSLTKLERLTLSNNHLTSLPEEIGGLQRLSSLHLANNHLKEFPKPVCQLRNLTFLDATDNRISTIPETICQLQKLETLLLLFNSLTQLPRGICSLKALRTLWLGHNKLKVLPSAFGQLAKLDWGSNYCSCNFEGNPLEKPPLEVCSGGPVEIRQYFPPLVIPVEVRISLVKDPLIPIWTPRDILAAAAAGFKGSVRAPLKACHGCSRGLWARRPHKQPWCTLRGAETPTLKACSHCCISVYSMCMKYSNLTSICMSACFLQRIPLF
uniref:Disease resistance R13L4/SHOC-2-like LRR domain-containing protein n=1 Tax=Salvator merianae TaxID=96440 RepID=A0A8D0DJC8_SALMN